MSEEQVKEVLNMRRKGYSYSDIGRFFEKDHSTIMYHCKKSEIIPGKSPPKLLIPIPPVEKKNFSYITDGNEVINPGKDYEDYLAEERKRDWKKRKDMAPSLIHTLVDNQEKV